jgi:CHAT domain-containing protein
LGLFAQSRSDKPHLRAGSPPQVLVVGDPAFVGGTPAATPAVASAPAQATERAYLWEGGSPPKRLPDSRREAEGIAALYRGTIPLTDRGATERAVRARITSADVVHLATHGILRAEVPMASGVLLAEGVAPQTAAPERETDDDGALQAWELAALPLRAELAVLSACDTGRGRTLRNEGVIGLPRALLYAGCRSVVASQWRVGDVTTARLMVAFHSGLRNGLPKDEALRRAMNTLRSAGAGATGHPHFWAPFFLSGDPDNPNLGRKPAP